MDTQKMFGNNSLSAVVANRMQTRSVTDYQVKLARSVEHGCTIEDIGKLAIGGKLNLPVEEPSLDMHCGDIMPCFDDLR